MSKAKAGAVVDEQLESLHDLAEAVHYNQWIADLIAPYLGRRIIDIGCGTGNFIPYLGDRKILGLDGNAGYLRVARDRFRQQKNITFSKAELNERLGRFRSFKADTIIVINVLEHVERDRNLIDQCASLLPSNGKLILFVPAIPWLFGEMDRTYGHFRRYSKRELLNKLKLEGLQTERCEYLNISGTFGWWLNGMVLKRKRIPRDQMLAYDKILPKVMGFEKLLPKWLGLSLLSVSRKVG